MPGFDTPALLEAVDAILSTVTGIQSSQIGVPSSFTSRVSAYCAASGQRFPVDLEAFGGVEYGRLTRVAQIVVGFSYATGTTATDPTDREVIATAELTLAGWIDAFIRAVLTDATLKALCEDMHLDLSLAGLPEYRDWGGREIRHWLCLIECQQSEEV